MVSLVGKVLPYVASGLFAVLLIWALIRFFRYSAKPCPLTARKKAALTKVLIITAAAFLASRFIIFGGGMIGAIINGSLRTYLARPVQYWVRWDAPHYIGLIENWYVNEGDPRFHIVFFPLYPAICRLICLATGMSARASAFIVSNAAFMGCGVIMFRLTEREMGTRGGVRAMLMFMFSPLTLFCSIPYTESIYLLTTLLAVYFARNRRFFWAVVMGALSANSRMVGMAAAIPIYFEMIRASEGGLAKRYIFTAIKVLPVSVGLIAYLLLNYQVTGDMFKFMQYQSEHWGQNFGTIYNTVGYTFTNAVTYDLFSYRIGVWIPQIIAIFVSLALLLMSARRLHPGDLAFGSAYFYVSVVPTWLLSGPRYMTAMYPAYPALTALTRKKAVFISLLAVSAVLCALCGALYSVKGCIL